MPSITDKFGKASLSSDVAIATTVKTTRAAGVNVLEAIDLSKYATDTPVFVVTYGKTTDPVTGIVTITKLRSWKALVNTGANTLTNLTIQPGYADDIGNVVGDFIECIPTSAWENSLIDGILAHANPDGSLITAAVKAALGQDGNLVQTLVDLQNNTVISGGTLTFISGLNASMSLVTAYIDGYKNTVAAVASRAYTANKDTYVDILRNTGTNAFSLVYTEVANNAASPALAANSLRLGIVVSGASIANQASINQGQSRRILPLVAGRNLTKVDTLGNIIYPRDPNRKVIGHAFTAGNASTASGTSVPIAGLFSPVIIPDGRDIKIIVDIELGQAASVYADLDIYDGAVPAGVLLNWKRNWYNDNSGRAHEVHMTTIPDRLTAGLHTISVGYHAEGGGTASYNSSGGGTELIVELV